VDVLCECCLTFHLSVFLTLELSVTLSVFRSHTLTKHCTVSTDFFCFNVVKPWQGEIVAQA